VNLVSYKKKGNKNRSDVSPGNPLSTAEKKRKKERNVPDGLAGGIKGAIVAGTIKNRITKIGAIDEGGKRKEENDTEQL